MLLFQWLAFVVNCQPERLILAGAVELFTAATIIFMADPIKAVVKINLVVTWVILMSLYTAGRGVMQMEDRDVRRKALIYARVVGVIVMAAVSWFGFIS